MDLWQTYLWSEKQWTRAGPDSRSSRATAHSIRQIARRLNADQAPPPTGDPTWGASTLGRLLRTEAYLGRVYFNRTEVVGDLRPDRKPRQVRWTTQGKVDDANRVSRWVRLF